MKKLLSAALCLLLSAQAMAQSETEFIRTSLVAGLGANQIDGDEMAGYNKPGFIVGAATRFLITETLGFQPEVLFMQKGSRTTSEQEEALFMRIHWKANYIEIPVLLTWEFYPGFSLTGGGAYSYLLSAKLDNGSGAVDMKNEFNKSDLLWVAGLDFQPGDKVSFGLRMEKSLISITKNTYNRPNFFNKSIGVTLRYHLGK